MGCDTIVIDTLTTAHSPYWDIPTVEDAVHEFDNHKIDLIPIDLTCNWVPIPADWKKLMGDDTRFDLEGFVINGLEQSKQYLLHFAYSQDPNEKDIIGMIWVTGGERNGGLKCPQLIPKEGFKIWMRKHEGGKEDIEIALLYNKWKV